MRGGVTTNEKIYLSIWIAGVIAPLRRYREHRSRACLRTIGVLSHGDQCPLFPVTPSGVIGGSEVVDPHERLSPGLSSRVLDAPIGILCMI